MTYAPQLHKSLRPIVALENKYSHILFSVLASYEVSKQYVEHILLAKESFA